jgi:hypothetical protein
VFEDFDLGPAGQTKERRYTVNSQLLTGFLMNLADDVSMCDVGTTVRFPVIITSNNLGTLHGPLMRPGRMQIFTWDPDRVERAVMIASVLENRVAGLDERVLEKLARSYTGLPISAFATALNDCIAYRIYEKVEDGMVNLETAQREWGQSLCFELAEVEKRLSHIGHAMGKQKMTYLGGFR